MPKPLPFTENAVKKAVAAVRKAGLDVSTVTIAPDGTITVSNQKPSEPRTGADQQRASQDIIL
jgi:hypothetical protein